MATFQPLPRWQDFLPNNLKARDCIDELLKNWLVEDGKAFWFSQSSHAIAAIGSFWKKNNNNRNAVIWFPEYFCNQATIPIRELGLELAFYPIKEDLSPNWSRCADLAKKTPPDLFVIVHYFGVANVGLMAKMFCERFGALVIEDAAHVVRPYKDIGFRGEFSSQKISFSPIP